MLILLTNDDGIHSPGLHIFAETLGEMAQVVIVAPDREQSATSHAITLYRPLRLNRHSENAYSVDGTPTDCIVLGMGKVLTSKPDIILSGINSGPNLGDDVHYSGTVSAAFEGAILGIKSAAVSLAHQGSPPFHFLTAAQFMLRFCRQLIALDLPQGLLFNVNVPNLSPQTPLEYVMTKQGKRNYGSEIIEKADPRGRKYYWIGGNQQDFYPVKNSDCDVVSQKKISITPLQVDMTDDAYMDTLKSWKF